MPQLRNTKHEVFCDAFVTCEKPRRAAITAGYAPASASSQAYVLRQRPDIQNRIRELQSMTPLARNILRKQLIDALGLYAFGGIGKVFKNRDGGNLAIDINTITPEDFTGVDVTLKIKKTRRGTTVTLRAKMTGKLEALKMLRRLYPPESTFKRTPSYVPYVSEIEEIRIIGVSPDHGE